MAAALFNLNLEIGSDQALDIFWINPDKSPVNLTGFSFRAQVRWSYTDNTPIFTWDSTPPNGGIVVSPTLGKLTLNITNQQGQGLKNGVGVWDLFATSPSGKKTKLVKGNAIIFQQVTEPL